MSFEQPFPQVKLFWRELPIATRSHLEHKLEGLYGVKEDEHAFDSLAIDKQQTLLIFMQRLNALGLWRELLRVENVYGEGGVGLDFTAHRHLLAVLRRRADFTTRQAKHRGTITGFLEKGRRQAALHFLFHQRELHRWSVHFDLYSPLALPFNAWRHLWWEKIHGHTPDWRIIKKALNQER